MSLRTVLRLKGLLISATALLCVAPAQAQLNASAGETFNQGTEAMRTGALEDAAGDFSKVIALNPSFAQAYSSHRLPFSH